MSPIVEVNRLTKRYGSFTALNQVSFSLEEGKIYGLLGRNGAGKTTVMHLLTAQLMATEGTVKVFGEHPYENRNVLDRICFIKESQKYPDTFRVKDIISTAASLFPNWDNDYAASLLQQFQLPLDRRFKKLSKGMSSSVGIIIGLASRAPLTIFDEPYLGLDVVARSMFYDLLIEDYGSHPRTIILSTHLIDEISPMLEHVILIDRGEIKINEEAERLRDKGYSVSGPAGKVDVFTAGKQVLSRSALGGYATAVVLGGSPSERYSAAEQGLEVKPVSLQELIVHMTKMNRPAHEQGGIK
ncbi:ABC transporter ATP-binding protein [Paenibacillus protaetiae]|uniref:ABC transporter ATP-binding protein n=1 Tax=Paenibacillus protaetiae TaxID=2509456 RepID=A0A4P6EWQ3_9BACL|nr:ABC transporter ATP-binding protein [Paenibacillus protaetiae]QAY67820.1 ABC transporter ATP-binding protein [Paenibacillus protaetiae]